MQSITGKRKILLEIILLVLTTASLPHALTLTATDLYNQSRADALHLSRTGDRVILDPRSEGTPQLETDCIDLLDPANTTVCSSSVLTAAHITVKSTVPEGASLVLSTRTGNRFYSDKGWSPWTPAKALEEHLTALKGRYLQIRLSFSSGPSNASPSVESIGISAEAKAGKPYKQALKISLFYEKIQPSAFAYTWERSDNPVIKAFVKKTGYAETYTRGLNELEKFKYLNTAVAKTANPDHEGWNADYPWDVAKLCPWRGDTLTIKGHCMSYAAVLVTAFTGMGQYARHWAVNGFRDMDHEVVEVWSNELKKWLFFDPSLSQYYLAPDTKLPMSILELHDVFVKTYLKDNETLSSIPMDSLKKRVKTLGGGKKAALICVDSGWHYGKPAAADYDWGWYHGYMTEGFMRLTTRNDYHSNPKAFFNRFGEGIAMYSPFPQYIDANTPPKTPEIKLFSGRVRDFWPSINQAAFKARRTGENTIELEFGNSQPFFKRYMVSVDNGKPVPAGSPYVWKLKNGENSLTVLPEDEWGTRGIGSGLAVSY